jgi:RimJ/RimL family protein N-acetyltransferase
MVLVGGRTVLGVISPELARRIVARDEQPGDDWHAEYPFVDELDPLRALADSSGTDPVFTMYLVRRRSDGLAVGGIGFFGLPDAAGTVEFGYGLVPAARGAGLATEAVELLLRHAADNGARAAVADTDVANVASQRVLEKNGFVEVGRSAALVYYRRELV